MTEVPQADNMTTTIKKNAGPGWRAVFKRVLFLKVAARANYFNSVSANTRELINRVKSCGAGRAERKSAVHTVAESGSRTVQQIQDVCKNAAEDRFQ